MGKVVVFENDQLGLRRLLRTPLGDGSWPGRKVVSTTRSRSCSPPLPEKLSYVRLSPGRFITFTLFSMGSNVFGRVGFSEPPIAVTLDDNGHYGIPCQRRHQHPLLHSQRNRVLSPYHQRHRICIDATSQRSGH